MQETLNPNKHIYKIHIFFVAIFIGYKTPNQSILDIIKRINYISIIKNIGSFRIEYFSSKLMNNLTIFFRY